MVLWKRLQVEDMAQAALEGKLLGLNMANGSAYSNGDTSVDMECLAAEAT